MRMRGEVARKLDTVAERTHVVLVTQTSARTNAIRAIRRLESSTVKALAGTTLRGLPELAPNIHALRVRSSARNRGLQLQPFEPALVISPSGHLKMAGIHGMYLAEDATLRSEDLEPFCDALREALAMHLIRTEKASVRYQAIDDLAKKLCDAFVG